MKLLIVRHGDPDYSIDSLTEKGWREAHYLADRLTKTPADFYYCSPLGRAQDTAKETMERLHRSYEVLPWLREFQTAIHRPDVPDRLIGCWDWLPADWADVPQFHRHGEWLEHPVMKDGDVKKEYDWVIEGLDQLILRHGYRREGNLYKGERGNNDTIVLFCHFGVESVLLSRLINIPPMLIWHGMAAAPTSVTTVVTEERREGTAYFRMTAFGDTSHLYANDEPPAFAARFIEKWGNEGERID